MLSGFDLGMSWKDEMAVCMSAHDGQEGGEEDERGSKRSTRKGLESLLFIEYVYKNRESSYS